MATKDRRREFRLAATDDDLLVEAAGLVGVTVSEFVLDRALHDAEAIVHAHHTVTLSDAARARFIAVLDAPLRRNERLAAQARAARRLKHAEADGLPTVADPLPTRASPCGLLRPTPVSAATAMRS